MFFSVTHSIRIAGKVYVPCVCYNLSKYLELTVKELSAKGKATIHDRMVFFQNGKIIKEKAVVKENLTTQKKEEKTEEAEKTLFTEETEDDSETAGF